ncbi:hypothetical protein Fmac_026760 [Flemingia macrophylla]|uniref:Uncharacterized protein n=1 Tax=Flemingia macrophylla TaxID=520843 RepID=A0ABD1LFX9_9FABA
MSRHRRQASQVLPPEILAGDDLTKSSFDHTQEVAEGATTKSATTNPHHHGSETTLTSPPATATKKPPPPGKAT